MGPLPALQWLKNFASEITGDKSLVFRVLRVACYVFAAIEITEGITEIPEIAIDALALYRLIVTSPIQSVLEIFGISISNQTIDLLLIWSIASSSLLRALPANGPDTSKIQQEIDDFKFSPDDDDDELDLVEKEIAKEEYLKANENSSPVGSLISVLILFPLMFIVAGLGWVSVFVTALGLFMSIIYFWGNKHEVEEYLAHLEDSDLDSMSEKFAKTQSLVELRRANLRQFLEPVILAIGVALVLAALGKFLN